jgi:hypothetical protein
MSESIIVYKKSFEDELDWNILDQLHKVVLQISTFCFRTKQICLTVEFVVIGLLIKFTNDKLDESIFVAGLAIPLCFWFLDGVAYFYQVKLRGVMDNIREQLHKRNSTPMVADIHGKVIEQRRINRSQLIKIITSFINHSMWIYFFLLCADVILWLLFRKGVIE